MQRNMFHISAQPAVCPVRLGGNNIGVAGGGDKEYEHKIGGCKAVCHFIQKGRGRRKVKYAYCN
eukprot:13391273-Ditylum_brightwellii.AAC.1